MRRHRNQKMQVVFRNMALDYLNIHRLADILPEVVEHIYLAGGFGFYLNLENTFASGLLPLEFKGKVKSIGNASGAGSISVLLKPDLIELASKIKTKVKTIDLANNPKFTNRFMENILFE